MHDRRTFTHIEARRSCYALTDRRNDSGPLFVVLEISRIVGRWGEVSRIDNETSIVNLYVTPGTLFSPSSHFTVVDEERVKLVIDGSFRFRFARRLMVIVGYLSKLGTRFEVGYAVIAATILDSRLTAKPPARTSEPIGGVPRSFWNDTRVCRSIEFRPGRGVANNWREVTENSGRSWCDSSGERDLSERSTRSTGGCVVIGFGGGGWYAPGSRKPVGTWASFTSVYSCWEFWSGAGSHRKGECFFTLPFHDVVLFILSIHRLRTWQRNPRDSSEGKFHPWILCTYRLRGAYTVTYRVYERHAWTLSAMSRDFIVVTPGNGKTVYPTITYSNIFEIGPIYRASK